MTVRVELDKNSYDIQIVRGLLKRAGKELNLQRKVLIVTDTGVPEAYARCVAQQAPEPVIVTIPQGEQSKCIATWEALLKKMLASSFTRHDCVVAVGGGVVGDLAGFAAATYMRGIDFYNIPTTLLSQVDSSVGGKTAVDLDGVKNIVGAFYQPKKVLIDPEVLQTLDKRQFACGMAEAIKMAACFDKAFFERMERESGETIIDAVIENSVRIKARVVALDEKEAGLRKVLNFGHTYGHAIEANSTYLHGESVALGMLRMCSPEVNGRLKQLFERYGLPTECHIQQKQLTDTLKHDKKAAADGIDTVFVETVGSYEIRRIRF